MNITHLHIGQNENCGDTIVYQVKNVVVGQNPCEYIQQTNYITKNDFDTCI